MSRSSHWLLVVHGTILYGWLALLIVQTVLVYRERTDLHQQVGTWIGIGWGLLVFLSGLSVAFGSVSPDESLQQFVSSLLGVTLPSIFAFPILFGAGIAYRHRPAVHKRLILVATLTLLSAATFRIWRFVFGLSSASSTLLGRAIPTVLAGVAAGLDRYLRGRVHPAYWVAGAVLVLSDLVGVATLTDAWTAFTGQIAGWLKSVLMPLM